MTTSDAAVRPRAGRRFEHLDMLRGAAALLVLLGHARGFVFLDYSQLSGAKLAVAPFYVLTGLGHQAVVLFFALSGFLVGGRALREAAAGRWNLPDYAVHRFARLWTALIPALILTALLDSVGRDLLHLPGYRGEYAEMLASGPTGQAHGTSALTFLGNIVFLQTIAVPVFGSNGPLWSLANEFWYYFLFPFSWIAFSRHAGERFRIAAALLATAIFFLLPIGILLLGSIWLAGAFAWRLREPLAGLNTRRFSLLLAAVTLAVLLGILASLARPGLVTDIALGIASALWLPCLVRLPNVGALYGRLAFWISEISFTLYVVHFPVIALLAFALLSPTQYAITPSGVAAFAGLVVAAIVATWGMWWAFERNTPLVRRFLAARLGLDPR